MLSLVTLIAGGKSWQASQVPAEPGMDERRCFCVSLANRVPDLRASPGQLCSFMDLGHVLFFCGDLPKCGG